MYEVEISSYIAANDLQDCRDKQRFMTDNHSLNFGGSCSRAGSNSQINGDNTYSKSSESRPIVTMVLVRYTQFKIKKLAAAEVGNDISLN